MSASLAVRILRGCLAFAFAPYPDLQEGRPVALAAFWFPSALLALEGGSAFLRLARILSKWHAGMGLLLGLSCLACGQVGSRVALDRAGIWLCSRLNARFEVGRDCN